MPYFRDQRWPAAALLLSATCLCTPALAGSFALEEGNADWMANAYAGEASKAYDASTAWANPAGMVRLSGNEIDSSLNFVDPSFKFSGTNTNFPDPAAAGATSQGVKAINGAATAGFFAVFSASPVLKLGFAIRSPFGARIDYPTNWVGRYQSLVSSLTDIQFEPSVAYAITPQFSVGGGPVMDYMSVRETKAVLPALPVYTGDIIADVHGQDWALGWNVSALYQFDPATRLGISYRSRIQHTVEILQTNTASASLAAGPFGPFVAGLLASQHAPGTLSLNGVQNFDLPDSADVSFYHDITPEWAVMAEAIWTHWQVFNHITITTIDTGNAPVTTQFNFHNTVLASAGASFRPASIPQLLLQGGAGYDQDPVTNATRQAQIPTDNRVLIGVGFTYDLTRAISFEAGYAHYFGLNATIKSTGPSPANAFELPSGVLTGKYSDTIDTFSGGIKFRF